MARAHLDEALKIGSLLDDLLLVSEVLADRGALHRDRGRVGDALKDWSRAVEGFTTLGAHRDVHRVTTLLESLPGPGDALSHMTPSPT